MKSRARKRAKVSAIPVKQEAVIVLKEEDIAVTSPLKVATLQLDSSWKWLGTSRNELTLDFTLPTGQSFRWRKSGPSDYTGVIRQRLIQVRQPEEDVAYRIIARGPRESESDDHQILVDYFNLHTDLSSMTKDWAAKDSRFRLVSPYFPGARILRQDPVECLFQFICSSNNHISRIHGMVERLCKEYGTALKQPEALESSNIVSVVTEKEKDPVAFYAFPTLEQLSVASEQSLRGDGFGYRAKFIVGSVKALMAKEEGGEQWLQSLRTRPYSEAQKELMQLPGIGPKVAACICLFALDKHEAIPVDTHVWQLAIKHYTPALKGKTLTPKIMVAVEEAFIQKFGQYAGWAHNVLFISDLASSKTHLPEHLWPKTQGKSEKIKKRKSDPELESKDSIK